MLYQIRHRRLVQPLGAGGITVKLRIKFAEIGFPSPMHSRRILFLDCNYLAILVAKLFAKELRAKY